MSKCIESGELEEVLRLDEAHPRRRHLDECPKCRALLLVYREFLEDDSVPTAADPQGAAARMRRAFHEDMAARKGGNAFFTFLRQFRLRPMWAAAAAAVVIALLYAGLEFRPWERSSDVLRQAPEEASPAGAIRVFPLPPVIGREGVELRWRRVPQAENYRLRVFGTDLKELAKFGPLSDTMVVLRSVQIPNASAASVLGWQVEAIARGDVIAVSPIGSFRVP